MNTWIFQATPQYYDIREKLHEGQRETWYATRYAKRMSRGDLVYFWLGGVSAEERGVYAWGTLTSEAYLKPSWDTHGVDVHVLRKLPRPLSVDIVREVSALANMLILRMAIGTNFLLSEAESLALRQLVEKADSTGPKIPKR